MPFVKGQVANPNGRPKKTVEEKYQKAVYSAIKPTDLKEIVEKLKERATRGDVQAAKLLLSYLLGLPVATTKLTGDGNELLKVIFEHTGNQNTTSGVSRESTGDNQ